MYKVGDKVKVKVRTGTLDFVIKKLTIVDKETFPNGVDVYRLSNGLFVESDEILGIVHDETYDKQKQELKI